MTRRPTPSVRNGPSGRPSIARSALWVLCFCVAACTGAPEAADSSATDNAGALLERRFDGPPPRPIETRDGDYKIASGGYADYMRHGFTPRADLEAYAISLPFNWKTDPFKDANWRFQLQAWRMLNPMWGEYRESAEPDVLEEILKVVRDWYRFHVLEGHRSSYQWQDMATGLRAQHIAYLNHLVADGRWTPEAADAQMLDALSDLHARKLHDDAFVSINNHGIFQVHGLRLLCNSVPEIEPCKGEPAFSAEHMRRLIESQFDVHGVHREDSSFYHMFAYKTFRGIRMTLYPELPRDALTRIREAESITPWFTGLDGNLLQFGDSEGSGVPFSHPRDAGRCWSTTADGQCVVAKDMHSSGYVSIRSMPGGEADEAFQFFVVGSSHDAGHDHVDELSFMLSHRGQPIFVDGGKYGYQNDSYRAYFVSDLAHSVVGLKGVAFRPEQTAGEGSYLERFIERDGTYEVAGEVRRGDDFAHRRTFRYVPASSLEISDRVDKPAQSMLELRYVFAPELRIEEEGGDEFGIRASDGQKLATLKLHGAVHCEIAFVRGRKQPDYGGWISTSYLAVEPTTNLIADCPSQVASIRTSVQLH
ncbi:heparinase II/III domain-containing protein [Marilutibacter chinensis]|uniref:Heparinase II/III family protein n=1 Tax=Marilutibacter chinensis TaxID=2912247 RepID=A0ABS9HQW4_9GAMM|nr:heparinase II/III family protein [Lysobacter chinensis]MCF7221316.1 heparinase II/III family protein [Lysobacter chinensis]